MKKISHLFFLIIFIITCGISNTRVTRENYEKIKEGMDKSKVSEILGKPASISETTISGLGKTEVWHYQLGMKAIMVTIRNGKVSSKTWTQI